jgi:hypothetical protein
MLRESSRFADERLRFQHPQNCLIGIVLMTAGWKAVLSVRCPPGCLGRVCGKIRALQLKEEFPL